MESYIGTIWSFGFGFTPVGWLPCDGRTVNIADYETLFNLIGTTFGGDGQMNFKLPNLQGRIPIGAGQGLGMANYVLGQAGGNESVTLTANNLPPHTHVPTASVPVADTATAVSPADAYFAPAADSVGNAYSTDFNAGESVNPAAMTAQPFGGSQPIPIVKPYQVVNYCICVEGIWPPQQ